MNQKNNDSKICPICGRPTHKESEYCIFHAGVEEKTEEEFKKALKEYVQKIKEEDRDYDFRDFIFVGEINFKEDLNATVFKNAYFNDATFEADANLSFLTFKGDVNLIGARFKGNANLSFSTLKRDVHLNRAILKKNADFSYSKFLSTYSFKDTCFEGNVLF